MNLQKKGTFFCDRTELRDYWELCAHILGGNSLNYIVYEKIKFSPKKIFFDDENIIFLKNYIIPAEISYYN